LYLKSTLISPISWLSYLNIDQPSENYDFEILVVTDSIDGRLTLDSIFTRNSRLGN